MDFDFENDTNRDFDEMCFNLAGQLMTMRNASPVRAAKASVALMRRVFGDDPTFRIWLAKRDSNEGSAPPGK